MATDAEVLGMLGRPVLADFVRCWYCGEPWRVCGPWHPGEQVGAYLAVVCYGCGATTSAGAP